jgi:hypothetical protein
MSSPAALRLNRHTTIFKSSTSTDESTKATHKPRKAIRRSLDMAVSCEHLTFEDIVDPFLLSPRTPYPAVNTQSAVQTEYLAKQTSKGFLLPMHTSHLRARSLGDIDWRTSPPRTPLPSTPVDISNMQQKSLLAITAHIQVGSTSTIPPSLAGSSTSTMSAFRESLSDSSFLHLDGSTTLQSTWSATTSEGDDESMLFHTAPGSPTECARFDIPKRQRRKLSKIPFGRHSSSTSTIRARLQPLFRRGVIQEKDSSSDTEEDRDEISTPVQSDIPRRKHKRGSSWLKVLDKLKSASDM